MLLPEKHAQSTCLVLLHPPNVLTQQKLNLQSLQTEAVICFQLYTSAYVPMLTKSQV